MPPEPFRWTDPRTWPWLFDVWLAFVLLGFAKPIWRWLQRERAEGWPATQGHIESTALNEHNWFRPSTSSSASIASFTYSYDVGGTKHTGTYKRHFGTDAESDDFLRDLAGRSVRIQYNPGRPSRSLVLNDSVAALLSSRGPSAAPPLEIHRYLNPLPHWLVRLLPVVNFLAIAGFLLSGWVNIGAVTGRWTPPGYFMALHGGIFLVFFPALWVAQKRVGNTRRKDVWRVVLQGAPDWMKYVLYALFAYAPTLQILPFLQGNRQSNPDPFHRFNQWTIFSLTWMVFYWASFVILYAALEQEKLGPRCVNGHRTPPGDNFCARCGQPVVRC